MKALNKAWRRCTPRFRRTEIHTVLTGNRSPALAGACPPTFRSISTKGYAERFAVYEKEKSSRLNLSKRSQLGRKRRKASASGTSNSTTEFQDTAHVRQQQTMCRVPNFACIYFTAEQSG
eukprot:gb/GECG01004594.1/.p1 GENE.gb/GECG01004594.1/~~gb/GECG01004594.1/.p1  ORF type:complete len:120 (+),score=10.29 gb/GECG01004594.1/:1-360(+)